MASLICGCARLWPPSRPASLARVRPGLQPQPSRDGSYCNVAGARVSHRDAMPRPPEENAGHPSSRYAIRPCSVFPGRHLTAEAEGSYLVWGHVSRVTPRQETGRRILPRNGTAGHGIIGHAAWISSGYAGPFHGTPSRGSGIVESFMFAWSPSPYPRLSSVPDEGRPPTSPLPPGPICLKRGISRKAVSPVCIPGDTSRLPAPALPKGTQPLPKREEASERSSGLPAERERIRPGSTRATNRRCLFRAIISGACP